MQYCTYVIHSSGKLGLFRGYPVGYWHGYCYKLLFISDKLLFTMLEKVLFEVDKLSNKELSTMLGITVMGAIKKRKAKSYSIQDAEVILAKYRVMFLDKK